MTIFRAVPPLFPAPPTLAASGMPALAAGLAMAPVPLVLAGLFRRGPRPCAHVELIADVTPSSPDGCTECLAAGDRWVHLRICLVCGQVGCCDNSKNRHATKHFQATGHPVIQSFELEGRWRFCYVDKAYVPEGEPFRRRA